MTLSLRIEAAQGGDVIVERQLLRFADEQEVPEVALREVGTIMRESIEKQFDTEGGYASGGWKPLTAERVATKARLGLEPGILRATDRLMHSLTRKFDPEHIERPSGSSLQFGSTVTYGIYHQSSEPRTKMPFRPPIAVTEGDKREMVRRIQAAVIGHMTGHGDKAVWGQ